LPACFRHQDLQRRQDGIIQWRFRPLENYIIACAASLCLDATVLLCHFGLIFALVLQIDHTVARTPNSLLLVEVVDTSPLCKISHSQAKPNRKVTCQQQHRFGNSLSCLKGSVHPKQPHHTVSYDKQSTTGT
jgi:hypothetical protein